VVAAMHIAVRGVRLQPDLQGRWRSLWVRLNADATHDTDPKNGIAAFSRGVPDDDASDQGC